MDALDQKLSTEMSEIKKMLIALHKQMQDNATGGGASSSSLQQRKSFTETQQIQQTAPKVGRKFLLKLPKFRYC